MRGTGWIRYQECSWLLALERQLQRVEEDREPLGEDVPDGRQERVRGVGLEDVDREVEQRRADDDQEDTENHVAGSTSGLVLDHDRREADDQEHRRVHQQDRPAAVHVQRGEGDVGAAERRNQAHSLDDPALLLHRHPHRDDGDEEE